jgi:hypothetical protein
MILPNKPAVRAPAKASNAGTPRGNSAPIRKAVAPVESAAPPAKAAARTKSTASNNSSTVTSPVKKVPPSAVFPTESADSTVIAGSVFYGKNNRNSMCYKIVNTCIFCYCLKYTKIMCIELFLAVSISKYCFCLCAYNFKLSILTNCISVFNVVSLRERSVVHLRVS